MTFDVLIVDDDFRVADLHARYVAALPRFRVAGQARTGAEALAAARTLGPDLVLLDSYLPDTPGVVVAAGLSCDVIMVTADSSPATVRAALAAGALNYVVKPFSARLLEARLAAYAQYRQMLSPTGGTLGQDEIDRATAALHAADRVPAPKGRSPVTERLVAEHVRESRSAVGAAALATELGISRATAQRYLAALADSGRVAVTLRYGTTGRPEHRYEWSGD